MKSLYEKKIRIYDSVFVKELDDVFGKHYKRYDSMNQFLVDMLRRGVEDLNAEPGVHTENDSLSEVAEELELELRYLRRLMDLLMAHTEAIEHLLATNLHVLMNMQEGKLSPKDDVDQGKFDEMPDYLKKRIIKVML